MGNGSNKIDFISTITYHKAFKAD